MAVVVNDDDAANEKRAEIHTRLIASNTRNIQDVEIVAATAMGYSCLNEWEKKYGSNILNRRGVWNGIEIMYELSAHVSVYAATCVIKLMTVRPGVRPFE